MWGASGYDWDLLLRPQHTDAARWNPYRYFCVLLQVYPRRQLRVENGRSNADPILNPIPHKDSIFHAPGKGVRARGSSININAHVLRSNYDRNPIPDTDVCRQGNNHVTQWRSGDSGTEFCPLLRHPTFDKVCPPNKASDKRMRREKIDLARGRLLKNLPVIHDRYAIR